jgi:putative ABC transport system permease protein
MRDWRAELLSRLPEPSTVREESLEEIALHLEQRYLALLARGYPEAQAYADTLREILSQSSFVPPRGEAHPALRSLVAAPGRLVRDARFALRLARRNAAFTTVAVTTLALGIAATTAIFSVVYGLFFAPLPYTRPDRLVMVWEYLNGDRMGASPKSYMAWKRQASVFADINAWGGRSVNLATGDRPENVSAGLATPGFLAMLGYGHPLALGRSFREDEGVSGRDRVVILTHQIWQERFGGDPGILGRQVRVDDMPYTVVGVLGEGPADRQQVKIWLPLAFTERQLQSDGTGLLVMARLKDDLTVPQANASMAALGARLERERPEPRSGWTVRVEAFRNNFVQASTTRGIWLLLAAVIFLLLIACTNVANLLLARGTARRRELAIRLAIGATRRSIVGQLLTESLILALAGGLLGALLATAIVDAIVALMPPFTLPSETEITLSIPVLLFACLVCAVAGVIAGLAPAWQAARTSAAEAMKEGGRAIGDRRFGVRRALVILEFSLALTLLAGGGMAVQALVRLMTADLGFRADHLTTFAVPVPRGRLQTPEQVRAFYASLCERIGALPGVAASSASTGMPVSGPGFRRQFEIPSARAADSSARPWAAVNVVTPSYHATFGVPIRRGRTFADTDRDGSRPVAIVNEAFAARFLPGSDPIGQHLLLPPVTIERPGGPTPPPLDWEIVGVQADANNDGPGRPVVPEIVLPFAQSPWAGALVAVRTIGDVTMPQTAIADILRSLDPTLPLARVRTIEQTLSESTAADRFYTVFLAAFAGLALALAAIGIYGVMSFVVAQRTHEIGLRMALGGGRRQVLGRILGEGMTTALIGTGLGTIGAAFIAGTLRGTIYGVEPSNPLPFMAVAVVLLTAALGACVVPARRAAAVDPMVALREP